MRPFPPFVARTECVAIASSGDAVERCCGQHRKLGELIGGAAYMPVAKRPGALDRQVKEVFMDWQAFSYSSVPLLLTAFLLDLAVGDPRWLPHPVVLMGKFISKGEE